MQDVEKTEIQRETSARRKRRRNRMRPLYGLCVTALVAGVGVALSMTAFFNIDTIKIDGEKSIYSKEEVAQASGVHTGDNLMRLKRSEVENQILSHLVFVDTVTVKKEFPGVLHITVTPSEAAWNLVDDSGTLQVSAAGKILVNGPDAAEALPIITGFEPSVREPGQQLTSKDSQKDSIFQTLSELMEGGLSYEITSVDLTDKYDIQVTFDSRIVFSLGNWSDMKYKITLAETVMGQLSEDKEGYLTMVGDHQCSYRDKTAVEQQTTAALTTTATDENGNPVVETDANGNPVSASTETTTETTTQSNW